MARMGKRRCSCGILVGKPEGSRPPVRRTCRWENNIKMDFQPIGLWAVVNWIYLAQNMDKWRALANRVINLRVPQNAANSKDSASCKPDA